MATIIFVLVLVVDKSIRLLLNRVVCKVHKQVLEVALLWSLIFLGCEAGETLLVDIDAQRVNAVDKRVDSEVELQVVNQVGLGHVALGNELIPLTQVNVLKLANQINAAPLTHVHRLDDEGFVLLFCELKLQISHILGQNPSFRVKLVVSFVLLAHAVEVLCKVVLAGQLLDLGQRVDPLVGSKFGDPVRWHHDV